jgi:hypothetical protein
VGGYICRWRGLGMRPAAERIRLLPDGTIEGLF